MWPPASPLPGRPPSLPRTGARAAARGPRVRAAAQSSGAGIRGPATPSVKGASRVGCGLEPEGNVARCGGDGPGGEPTAGTERPREKNSHSRSSRWLPLIISQVSCQLLYVVSLVYVTAPGGRYYNYSRWAGKETAAQRGRRSLAQEAHTARGHTAESGLKSGRLIPETLLTSSRCGRHDLSGSPGSGPDS